MIKTKRNLIADFGQFYTKQKVAKKQVEKLLLFLEKINLDKNNFLFIEPSAGKGDFLLSLKQNNLKVLAFDIYPKNENILKRDFLKEEIYFKDKNKKITIGNPPFGKRSKKAIDFFNKAAEFSEIISFIVPNQFKKYSVQKQLNKDFKLVKEYKISKNSFYTELDKEYNVNCIFQIWTKLDCKIKDKRMKIAPPIIHSDFEMFQYNNTKTSLKIFDNDFDFGVFSQGYGEYNKKIFDKKDFNLKKHYLLFKAKNRKVLSRLKKIDFEKLSRNNTTIPGFRKADVVKEYKRLWR